MLSLCNNKSHKCVNNFLGFLVNGHECHVNGAAKICLCDANKGYCGDDYQNCVKWTESDIRKDWGLTPNCKFSRKYLILVQ